MFCACSSETLLSFVGQLVVIEAPKGNEEASCKRFESKKYIKHIANEEKCTNSYSREGDR